MAKSPYPDPHESILDDISDLLAEDGVDEILFNRPSGAESPDPAPLVPSPIPASAFLPHLQAIDLPSSINPTDSTDSTLDHQYAFFIPQDDFQEFSAMIAAAPPGAFPWRGLLLPARFIPDPTSPSGRPQMLLEVASLEALYEWILREVGQTGHGPTGQMGTTEPAESTGS